MSDERGVSVCPGFFLVSVQLCGVCRVEREEVYDAAGFHETRTKVRRRWHRRAHRILSHRTESVSRWRGSGYVDLWPADPAASEWPFAASTSATQRSARPPAAPVHVLHVSRTPSALGTSGGLRENDAGESHVESS